MSIRLAVYLAVLGYGVWYTADPLRSLKRKYGEDEVPRFAVRAARIAGAIIILVGLAGAAHDIWQMISG